MQRILFFCGFHNGGFLSWILLPFICIIPFGLWRKFIYYQAAEIEIDFENSSLYNFSKIIKAFKKLIQIKYLANKKNHKFIPIFS